MTSGDPMATCPFCLQNYYVVNGHDCKNQHEYLQNLASVHSNFVKSEDKEKYVKIKSEIKGFLSYLESKSIFCMYKTGAPVMSCTADEDYINKIIDKYVNARFLGDVYKNENK